VSSVLDTLSSIGGRIPGWTPIVFLGLFIVLLLMGRFLNLLDTSTAGVEKAVGDAEVNGTTLRSYFIDYGYRSYARAVWSIIVTIFGSLFVISAIAVMANAFKSPGWERE
jgi:uncharacterized membrane protein